MRMARVRRWSNGQSAELVGVAEPIGRCGEYGGEGRRGLIAARDECDSEKHKPASAHGARPYGFAPEPSVG